MTSAYCLFHLRKRITGAYKYVSGSNQVSPFGAEAADRKSTISASKAACVLSLGYVSRSKYLTQLMDGKGEETESDKTDCFLMSALNHGKQYEDEAASRFFSTEIGKRWRQLTHIHKQHTFKSCFQNTETKQLITVIATPDLVVVDENLNTSLVEIKCPYFAYKTSSGFNFESIVSDKHYIQCQVQMMVTGVPSVYLFFYIPEKSYCIFLIDEDKEFQTFLLQHFETAYQEVKDSDFSHFKCYSGEVIHNKNQVLKSKEAKCKFLSSE